MNSPASPPRSTRPVGRTWTASDWLPIGAGPLLWSQYRLNTGWATSAPRSSPRPSGAAAPERGPRQGPGAAGTVASSDAARRSLTGAATAVPPPSAAGPLGQGQGLARLLQEVGPVGPEDGEERCPRRPRPGGRSAS